MLSAPGMWGLQETWEDLEAIPVSASGWRKGGAWWKTRAPQGVSLF